MGNVAIILRNTKRAIVSYRIAISKTGNSVRISLVIMNNNYEMNLSPAAY
jgi:hypothetical protein